jgi:hypothetical protein
MRRFPVAVKRCVICGRRVGIRGKAVEIDGGDAAHLTCAWELVEDASERPVEDLLAEWERLAVLVESGEVFPTDDLTLALASRDVLEQRRGRLAWAEAERLDRIDTRYRAATHPDEAGFLATLWPHGGGWWWLRLPVSLEAESRKGATQARD